jgi:hypothetical protein
VDLNIRENAYPKNAKQNQRGGVYTNQEVPNRPQFGIKSTVPGTRLSGHGI